MFSWVNCAFEIYQIADAKRKGDYPECTLGDAYDMFKSDVWCGKAIEGNTDGILKDFDFAAAKTEWDAMSQADQDKAYADIRQFIKSPIIHDNLDSVRNNREEFQKIVDKWYAINDNPEAVKEEFGDK